MNGYVALNGTVPSYPQYLEAAKAARRIAGVARYSQVRRHHRAHNRLRRRPGPRTLIPVPREARRLP
jgi:hypothetical protein